MGPFTAAVTDTVTDTAPIGDVLDLSGINVTSITYDPSDPAGESGTLVYVNDAGQHITGAFSEIESVVTCFARSTLIETIKGEVVIEDLSTEDLILTQDNGFQALKWIGSKTVCAIGKHAPIVIKAGALDNHSDLLLSPNHRMQIEGWKAQLLFGCSRVLALAKHLTNGDTIFALAMGKVEYFHMMFDRHEIVYSNGSATESFHPSAASVSALDCAAREEILDLFPNLRDPFQSYGPSARPTLKSYETRAFNS